MAENRNTVYKKSLGTTPTEQSLAALCEKSFLKLWSYPNLYRDQKWNGGTGKGKEVADLIVASGTKAIIFSDKLCSYPDSGNYSQDWKRWYKRTVHKGTDQVLGAERWIKKFPDRLYLDRHCTQRFPLAAKYQKIFKCVVARGSSERCRKFYDGTGSHIIVGNLRGREHMAISDPLVMPFVIGNPAENDRDFVHVFNEHSLKILLSELDTINDFCDYLQGKESFYKTGRFVIAFSEEDLLAWYLYERGGEGQREFPDPGEDRHVILERGKYENCQANLQVIAKKNIDQISYLWDHVIDEFGQHLLAGTSLYAGDQALTKSEYALRYMSQERRFDRRILSNALMGIVNQTHEKTFGFRSIKSNTHVGLYYVFCVFGNRFDIPEKEYRSLRRVLLSDYCIASLSRFDDADIILGLATEPDPSRATRSHDIALLHRSDASPSEIEDALKAMNDLGLFVGKYHTFHVHDDEYPDLG